MDPEGYEDYLHYYGKQREKEERGRRNELTKALY